MTASSNRKIIYFCDQCKQEKPRDNLSAKRVTFTTMGEGFRVLRSRTVAWLCDTCRDSDPAWTQPKLTGSPGMADVRG